MVDQIFEVLDRALYRRGFTHEDTRVLLRIQIIVALATSILALIAALGNSWGWGYAVGSGLATFNFWWLVRFGQNALLNTGSLVGRAVMRFYLRLGGTAVLLYVLIVRANAPVWAVLAGMSTVMVAILLWGARSRAGSNSAKEA